MPISLTQARQRWAQGQHLHADYPGSLVDLVASTGWIRTLGGVEAYLALRARRSATTIDEVHAACARGDLRVVPAVRGCIYLVPRRHVGMALRVAAQLSARRMARDHSKVGLDQEEIDHVGDAIVEVLKRGPRSTRELRRDLGDLVRSFGAVGKKIGLSSNLPPILRLLEFAGRIERRVQDDRLDHERYRWTMAGTDLDDRPEDEVYAELARLYFRWAGPATLDAFAAWSGLGKRAANMAVAGLMQVDVEGLGACLAIDDVDAAASGRLALLPALDNLPTLREDVAPMVDVADRDVLVGNFGRPATVRLGDARNLLERVVAVDGRITGLWAYDPTSQQVVVRTFDEVHRACGLAEAQVVADFLVPLGHGKVLSLDKDATLQKRLDRVLALP